MICATSLAGYPEIIRNITALIINIALRALKDGLWACASSG